MNNEGLLVAKLDEIYQVIDRQHHNVHEIGVLAGLSGLAIFCYEYARFTNTNAPAELGEALLARTIDSINALLLKEDVVTTRFKSILDDIGQSLSKISNQVAKKVLVEI